MAAEHPDLEEGHIIGGKLRLVRPLARGGMGAVWVARHLQLDTDVAVKLMTPELVSCASARARFEREARASALLRSPYVVQVLDYGIDGETPYLVMELLEGEDLAERLRRVTRLSPAQALKIIDPVCKALRRAHEAGLVHRDLKPSNVFLARSGDEEIVKVLDFGVAKSTSFASSGEVTKSGALVGSPLYMSPEQIRRSKEVDHRSDLWSTGVMLYRMLTGRLPFTEDDVGALLVSICTDPYPAPSSLVPALGAEVDGFFERALARRPGDRFQSARELADAFSALVSSAERRIRAIEDEDTVALEDLDLPRPVSPADPVPGAAATTPPSGDGTLSPAGNTGAPVSATPRRGLSLGVVGLCLAATILGIAGVVGLGRPDTESGAAAAGSAPPSSRAPEGTPAPLAGAASQQNTYSETTGSSGQTTATAFDAGVPRSPSVPVVPAAAPRTPASTSGPVPAPKPAPSASASAAPTQVPAPRRSSSMTRSQELEPATEWPQ